MNNIQRVVRCGHTDVYCMYLVGLEQRFGRAPIFHIERSGYGLGPRQIDVGYDRFNLWHLLVGCQMLLSDLPTADDSYFNQAVLLLPAFGTVRLSQMVWKRPDSGRH